MTALGDDALQREHRRIRGQHDELLARGRELEAAVERALEARLELDRVLVEAGVLEPQGELCRPVARDDDALEPLEQRLEVHVPDPRDVPAVAIWSFRATTAS